MTRRVGLAMLMIALNLAALWWVVRFGGVEGSALSPEQMRAFVLSFGGWAPAVYLLIYGQPLVPLPASVMMVAGGLVFGPLWGTVAAVGGATARACTQFWMVRIVGRESLAKFFKGRLTSVDQMIGAPGFNTVFLIRCIPNVPFDLQNYGLGMSRAPFWPYILATFLGVMPATCAFVYLGDALIHSKMFWKVLVAVGCVAALGMAQRLWKKRHAVA